MGISEITQSRKWKIFMKYIYGWGASVVLTGALFKILHLPGAAMMLVAGMGTEVIIFFLSAFEPLEEEVDWTQVYPELAGAGEEDEIEVGDTSKPDTRRGRAEGGGSESVEKFDEMLEQAGVGSEVFEKLGSGLNKLSDTASKLSDISEASVATEKYTKNMEQASKSAENLSSSYNESAQKIKQSTDNVADKMSSSADNLSDAHEHTAQKVKQSGDKLEKSYQELASKMNIDFTELSEGNKEYSNKMGTLNKNLSALNAIFELQLQDSDVEKMMEDLNNSAKEASKYYEEITKLQKKLEALNTVYGNMLTAMNVHTND